MLAYHSQQAATAAEHRAQYCCASHLGAVRRVDGMIDVRGVASELLEKLPRFEAMHTCKAIIRGAQDVGSIPREAERGDAL